MQHRQPDAIATTTLLSEYSKINLRDRPEMLNAGTGQSKNLVYEMLGRFEPMWMAIPILLEKTGGGTKNTTLWHGTLQDLTTFLGG